MAISSTTTTTTVSQLSCFSSLVKNNRNNLNHLQLRRSLTFSPPPLPKLSVVMSLEEKRNTEASSSDIKTSLGYTTDETNPTIEEQMQRCPFAGEHETNENGFVKDAKEHGVEEKTVDDSRKIYGSAKIHDFCFGIPYGGLVLSGGVLGSILSRNLATLGNGVLYGGGLLALCTFSLKVWRQGLSSIPFILAQAVLAARILWVNFEKYSLTKKLIPTGFYALISAAMLVFYSYVILSGGNPPPKKLQSTATVE